MNIYEHGGMAYQNFGCAMAIQAQLSLLQWQQQLLINLGLGHQNPLGLRLRVNQSLTSLRSLGLAFLHQDPQQYHGASKYGQTWTTQGFVVLALEVVAFRLDPARQST